ncbi:hypothetical protein [Bradyrhizobium sp. WSM3983]|nr:hypothetical protein [Bradyrhizobium sp. WSM3983]
MLSGELPNLAVAIAHGIDIIWLFRAKVSVYDPLTAFGKDWTQIRAGSRH